MGKSIVKSFSYKAEDKPVIEFLEGQPNQSKFILDLLRKAMEEASGEGLEAKIQRIVEKAMAEQNSGIRLRL